MPKFQVGDRVRVLFPRRTGEDQEGTVTRHSTLHGNVYVVRHTSDLGNIWYSESNLAHYDGLTRMVELQGKSNASL